MRRLCYFSAGLNIPLAAFAAATGRLEDFLVAIASGALLTWCARRIP